jgi:hypothetical protein
MLDVLDRRKFISIRSTFLAGQFQNLQTNSDSILLSSTRPTAQVDPIV